MSEVLVVGSLNADLVVRPPHFPKAGEAISSEVLQVIPGSKGSSFFLDKFVKQPVSAT